MAADEINILLFVYYPCLFKDSPLFREKLKTKTKHNPLYCVSLSANSITSTNVNAKSDLRCETFNQM